MVFDDKWSVLGIPIRGKMRDQFVRDKALKCRWQGGGARHHRQKSQSFSRRGY